MPKFVRVGMAVELEKGVLLHRQSSLVQRGDIVEVNAQVAEQFRKDKTNWRPIIDARRASPRRRQRERGGRDKW